jgi:hypothetical protein
MQGKYISGDERGGFHVAKVNLPLPELRLRLFIQGKGYWLEEGILVPVKKNKRGRIIEEGSSSAQEGGAQQNYVPPFGGIPTPPSYYGGPPMQAWGSGAAMRPQNYVMPNVTFAEPYTQYPQPQQSMAIIGGYATRNMQNVATIQSYAAQLGEGNANITYELGRLHLVPPGQFVGGDVQTCLSKGTTTKIINTPTASGRLRRRRSFSFLFFSLFCNFQLVFACVCVVFFSFYLNFSKCVSLYSACMLVCFHHE